MSSSGDGNTSDTSGDTRSEDGINGSEGMQAEDDESVVASGLDHLLGEDDFDDDEIEATLTEVEEDRGEELQQKERERQERQLKREAAKKERKAAKEKEREAAKETEKQQQPHRCAADRHANMTFETPDLLKKMWNEFTINSRHVNYNKPLNQLMRDKAVDNGEIVVSDTATIDSMNIEVPELSFDLDTEQFFTTLDVVRHVLLAPPPPKREYVRERTRAERA